MESSPSTARRPSPQLVIGTGENYRNNSTILDIDDDSKRHGQIREIVMLRQKLRQNIFQYKQVSARMRDISPDASLNTTFPRQYGYGDGPESPLVMEGGQSSEDENIQGMLALPEDIDELIELGNVSLSMTENDPGFKGSVSESIGNWLEENDDELLTKISTRAQIGGQLVVGNVAGYVGAILVKKLGKYVLCSLVGGFVVLKVAHGHGYINIDWSKVFQPDQVEEGPTESGSSTVTHDLSADVWIANKFGNFRDWIKKNSYFALGFGTGFAFKSFIKG